MNDAHLFSLLAKQESGELTRRERAQLDQTLLDPAIRDRAAAWQALHQATRKALAASRPEIDPRLRSDIQRALRLRTDSPRHPLWIPARWAWGLAAGLAGVLAAGVFLRPNPAAPQVAEADPPAAAVPEFQEDVLLAALDLFDGNPLPSWSSQSAFRGALYGSDPESVTYPAEETWTSGNGSG